MMRDFPLIIVALLVVCQVSAEEQVKDGAFADGVDTAICYDGRNLVGVIHSPGYGTSNSTYQISLISRIVFCNLPDIFWLHLDYLEKTPPTNGCISDTQLPYLIPNIDGGVISTDTGTCSMPTYQWNTLLFNQANVTVLLPAAGKRKANFIIHYRVVSCSIPNVKTVPVGLTTFNVTGCDDGYRLVGGTSGIFTCNNDDGKWEPESAVPKCLEESVTSSSPSVASKASASTSLKTSPATSSNTSPSTTSSTSSILSQSSSSTPPKLSPTSTSDDSAQTTSNSDPRITIIAVAVSVGGLLLLCIVIGILIYIIRRQSHHRKEQIEELNASAEGGSAGGPNTQSNRWHVADNAYDTISLHSGINSPSAAMPGNGNVSPDGQVNSAQTAETSEQPDGDTYTNSAQIKDREHEGRSNYSSILAANKSWRRPSDTVEMVESDIYST